MRRFWGDVGNVAWGVLLTPVWLPLFLGIVLLVGILYVSGYGRR